MNSAIMMLEKTAARFPDRVAVQEEGGEMTFSGLRSAGMSIAAALLDFDKFTAEPEAQTPVIVYMRKSIAALAVFTGAMYAGHPYVPLDFDMPVNRVQSIVGNIKEGYIVSLEADIERLAELDLCEMRLVSYESLIAGQADE